mmetsp:Transcript_37896/g.78702  ORF Transcript_37896/g.78702 Transcript_37896/m.78702 type:complete len:209 (-) Transcript_37896:118-744(-)
MDHLLLLLRRQISDMMCLWGLLAQILPHFMYRRSMIPLPQALPPMPAHSPKLLQSRTLVPQLLQNKCLVQASQLVPRISLRLHHRQQLNPLHLNHRLTLQRRHPSRQQSAVQSLRIRLLHHPRDLQRRLHLQCHQLLLPLLRLRRNGLMWAALSEALKCLLTTVPPSRLPGTTWSLVSPLCRKELGKCICIKKIPRGHRQIVSTMKKL